MATGLTGTLQAAGKLPEVLCLRASLGAASGALAEAAAGWCLCNPLGAPWESHMPRGPLRRAQWSWEAKPLALPAPSADRAEMVPAGEESWGNGKWTRSRGAGTWGLTLTCSQ